VAIPLVKTLSRKKGSLMKNILKESLETYHKANNSFDSFCDMMIEKHEIDIKKFEKKIREAKDEIETYLDLKEKKRYRDIEYQILNGDTTINQSGKNSSAQNINNGENTSCDNSIKVDGDATFNFGSEK
jgi:hypothetical protein